MCKPSRRRRRWKREEQQREDAEEFESKAPLRKECGNDDVHGAHAEDRNGRIHLLNLGVQGFAQNAGFAGSPKKNHGAIGRRLKNGEIDVGSGGRIEAVGPDIADHSDDGDPGILRRGALPAPRYSKLKALTNSIEIRARPVAMRKRFIDQSHWLALGVVGVGKESALQQRSFEDGKVCGADARDFGHRSSLEIERATLDGKGRLKTVEIHGQAGAIANCSLRDSGKSGDAPENFPVKGSTLFGSKVGVIF